jgi:transposase
VTPLAEPAGFASCAWSYGPGSSVRARRPRSGGKDDSDDDGGKEDGGEPEPDPEPEPDAGVRKRGQRQGSKGHGRRGYAHLQTREEIHDVPPDQRFCGCCGLEFEPLSSEPSEQIDWQVTVTRIVHRRKR